MCQGSIAVYVGGNQSAISSKFPLKKVRETKVVERFRQWPKSTDVVLNRCEQCVPPDKKQHEALNYGRTWSCILPPPMSWVLPAMYHRDAVKQAPVSRKKVSAFFNVAGRGGIANITGAISKDGQELSPTGLKLTEAATREIAEACHRFSVSGVWGKTAGTREFNAAGFRRRRMDEPTSSGSDAVDGHSGSLDVVDEGVRLHWRGRHNCGLF